MFSTFGQGVKHVQLECLKQLTFVNELYVFIIKISLVIMINFNKNDKY